MPVNWDDSNKFRLLLALIESMEVSKMPSWDAVAAKMGSEFTGQAVRQQYQKLKKNAAAEFNTDEGSAAAAPAPATPKPRKRATPKSKTPKRKTASSEADDSDHSGPPKKRQKTPSRKAREVAASKIKVEEPVEDSEDTNLDEFPGPSSE